MTALLLLVLIWSAGCLLMVNAWAQLRAGDWWAVMLTVICILCVVTLSAVVCSVWVLYRAGQKCTGFFERW